MAASWDVDVDGRTYVVSVERAENGKDVVRVDGRVIAKPLGSEDESREIMVGGAPYIVQRKGTTFEVVPDVSAALAIEIQQRNVVAAQTVLAHAKDAPFALSSDHKRFAWQLGAWGVVVALALVVISWIIPPSYAKQSGMRVKQVLDEMHTNKPDEMELAMALWAKNARHLDSMEMGWASTHFENWRKEKGLDRAFDRYEVTATKKLEGAPSQTAIVTFTVEGKEFTVRVPERQPMAWEP